MVTPLLVIVRRTDNFAERFAPVVMIFVKIR